MLSYRTMFLRGQTHLLCALMPLPLDWGGKSLYAFHLCVISRALRKLQDYGATALMILPLWPTQVWFPAALQMLAADPILLPRCPLLLLQQPTLAHPRAWGLVLTAMVLSRQCSHVEVFRQRLPSFSFGPGDLALRHNMGHVSTADCHFASAGKWICFNHL